MSQHTSAALTDLEQYLTAQGIKIDFPHLQKSLCAAAAAPSRPDNDKILDHILPNSSAEVRIRLAAARDSLRQNILNAVHAPEKTAERLTSLRRELDVGKIDGFIIPLNDEFHGEAAPAASERLKWLTGFTGSAGMAAVLAHEAAIFVDGRYTLQVRQEVNMDLFSPRHVSDEPLSAWLTQTMKPGQILAYDPWLHTESNVKTLTALAQKIGISLITVEKNPIDTVWADRPPEPLALVVPHEEAYSGEHSASKRDKIAAILEENGQDACVHTLPDVTAWLLNLRGADLPSTPFALGFSILHKDSTVDLYMQAEKLSEKLIPHLGNAVRLHDRSEFAVGLKSLKGKKVQLDPTVTSQWIVTQLEKTSAIITRANDPCMLPKATKNKTELIGTRSAHIRDGAAITKFLHWLSVQTPSGQVDELGAEQKLRSFRELGDHFKDLSFSTISGAGPNGAIVHYRATPATNRKLEGGSLYLVDSGGQYLDGTTDITRTVAIGTPTDEMKERFTLVLKGHIALAKAIFPKGTSGSQLDALARLPLWSRGLDYDHGTGHGVGSYLSVHEGPQRISKMPSTVALQPGMILSNEPGYYKTGEYGIRIENLVAVISKAKENGAERDMMAFETLTFAPIDKNALKIDLLDQGEKEWLNFYHRAVWQKISPLVDGEVKEWLELATTEI